MAFPGNRLWKRTVNVNHLKVTGGPHVGYPLGLIDVLPGDVYDIAQANGGDIRFTLDEAGTTKLPCEIVKFDPLTDTCQIWLPATVQSSATSTVWIWYGNSEPGTPMTQPVRTDNPDADGFQGSDYVFDADFMLVVHGEASLSDSSRYNRTPANNIGAPTFSAQQVGNGSVWNNASMSNHGTVTEVDAPTELTMECWALNTDAALVYDALVGKRSDLAPSGYFGLFLNTNANRDPYFSVRSASSFFSAIVTGTNINNVRRYVAGYYKGSTHVRCRVDSTMTTNTTSVPASLPTNTTVCSMGAQLNSSGVPSNYLAGTIDEYRLSRVDRGTDWTDTAQENMRNPSTFVTFGSPVALGGPPPSGRRVPPALLMALAA